MVGKTSNLQNCQTSLECRVPSESNGSRCFSQFIISQSCLLRSCWITCSFISLEKTVPSRFGSNSPNCLFFSHASPWQQIKYPADAVLYQHIGAPPSTRPITKVSDLSGIPTAYTDPRTQLHFASSEEFAVARYLPADVVTGYLTLRGSGHQQWCSLQCSILIFLCSHSQNDRTHMCTILWWWWVNLCLYRT